MSNKINIDEMNDVILIENKLYHDQRGSFREWINPQINKKLLDFSPIQINIVNSKKNVIRGLHTNSYNHQQNKLVTCAYGQIMDVVVDLRKNSSTFGKYSSIELTANMGNSIFIPNGFAHGYMVMSENAVVVYQVDKEYHPESEVILNPFDSELNIEWGENQFYILSARDQYSNNLSQLIREGSL